MKINIKTLGMILCSLLVYVNGFANMILTLKGKVVSFSPEVIVLETKKQNYHINRMMLERFESDKVNKPNQVVSLQVPVEAIKKINK